MIVAFALFACACSTESTSSKPSTEEPEPTASGDDDDDKQKPDPDPNLNDNGSLSVPQEIPERIVAIGDLHGDLDATRRVFRLAGATDEDDAWTGGKLVVVQTGDTVDRGDGDRAIIDFVERLKGEASKAGGKVVALVGNHEVMNTMLDFRYVTPGAFKAFADVTPANSTISKTIASLDEAQHGRAAAFLPGGPYAKILANRPVVARVGDTIFLHGGVLPKYVKDLDATNAGLKDWLLGKQDDAPEALSAEDGPLWLRDFSDGKPAKAECEALEETLTMLNAKRMVMGHTVQQAGINGVCDDKAWRIDVGLSSYYSGPTQVLELRGDELTVLKE